MGDFLFKLIMDIFSEIADQSENQRELLRADIQRALSGGSPIERDEPAGFQMEGVYFGETPPKMRADQYLRAATGWVYGCVARIADAIASMGLRLYKIDGDEIKEVLDHKSLELLEKVNSFTTRLDHFWLTQQYLELTGEGPWFVQRDKDGKGEPTSILLLRPDRLTVVQNEDKNAETPIKHYVYKAGPNNDITIKPSELIFLKYPDPVNWLRGKGTLEAAATTVDLDSFSEDFNKRFFYNSARPDMVLASEQELSQTQKAQLRGSIKKLYQGGNNAHKTLILEKGLKATPFSLSQKDMDFIEQQRFSMSKIFSIFGVPKSVMSVSDDVNLANAKVGEYIFAKYTVKPKMLRIAAQLNEFFLPMFKDSENLFFSFDDPVPGDVDARTKKYDSALGHGYMTINEIRSEENLPDIGELGDVTYLPNNMIPIEKAGETPPPVSFALKPGGGASKIRMRGIIERSAGGYTKAKQRGFIQKRKQKDNQAAAAKIDEVEKKINDFALAMVKQTIRTKKKAKKDETTERNEKFRVYGDIFVKAVRNYERAFRLGTEVIFEEQKKKILNKVPKKATVDLDDWLLDEEDEAKVMVRVYTPLMKQIIKDQGDRAGKLIGEGAGAFDLATKPVQDYLKNRTFEFSFEVNQETNAKISATLQEGVKNGEAIPELRERITTLFGDMEKYRAERIARSEVVRASNFAATEAYEQSGVVEQLQWLTTEDDRTDDECASMDGKIISLGESFLKQGENIGKLTMDYGDVDFPPLHPSCRCTVVPLVG